MFHEMLYILSKADKIADYRSRQSSYHAHHVSWKWFCALSFAFPRLQGRRLEIKLHAVNKRERFLQGHSKHYIFMLNPHVQILYLVLLMMCFTCKKWIYDNMQKLIYVVPHLTRKKDASWIMWWNMLCQECKVWCVFTTDRHYNLLSHTISRQPKVWWLTQKSPNKHKHH